MRTPNWQLQTPVDALVFDCDGTLSAIEGVDELAKLRDVYDEVGSLTAKAMNETGLNSQLYQQRLDLIYPHRDQVLALGQQYFQHQVPDVSKVIEILQRLNKSIYVVSAGLAPAVGLFGQLLKIPAKNIFAVDISFDKQGNFHTFDKASPLINHDGKRIIVSQLKNRHKEIIHIGDGQNDIVTYDLVRRFIGYGGVYYRESIANRCEYYIRSASLAPLLPLTLTPTELDQLSITEQSIYEQGLTYFLNGEVKSPVK